MGLLSLFTRNKVAAEEKLRQAAGDHTKSALDGDVFYSLALSRPLSENLEPNRFKMCARFFKVHSSQMDMHAFTRYLKANPIPPIYLYFTMTTESHDADLSIVRGAQERYLSSIESAKADSDKFLKENVEGVLRIFGNGFSADSEHDHFISSHTLANGYLEAVEAYTGENLKYYVGPGDAGYRYKYILITKEDFVCKT